MAASRNRGRRRGRGIFPRPPGTRVPAAAPARTVLARHRGRRAQPGGDRRYELVKAPDHAETCAWHVLVGGRLAGLVRPTWRPGPRRRRDQPAARLAAGAEERAGRHPARQPPPAREAPGEEVKALLIPADGPAREVDLPDGGSTWFMRSLRTLIGTQCAERIWVTSRWEAWLDEDATAAGKPPNQAATLLARSYGARFSLCGTVVIVGLDKDTPEPADLSPAQAGAILRKIRATSA